MTAEEFTRDENNRVQLRAIIDSPVFKHAVRLLKDELEPTPGNEGVGNPVVGAAKFQQLAGVNHILFGLERLTSEVRVRKPLPVKPALLPDHIVNPSV